MIIHCQHPYLWMKQHALHEHFELALRLYSLSKSYDSYGSEGWFVDYITPYDRRATIEDKMRANHIPDHEFGVDSKLRGGRILSNYLLTLDFLGKLPLDRVLADAKSIYGDEPFAIYNSGNSYHAYGSRIINRVGYLAKLALAARLPSVDHRWLSQPRHVLRWSCYQKPMILRVA